MGRFFTLDFDEKNQKMADIFVFLLRLMFLAVRFYLLMGFADLYFLQVITATNSLWLFQAMGMQAAQNGAQMAVNGFEFFISRDSTAWKSLLFMAALILAVPKASGRKRLIGIAVGIPSIWFANIGRGVAIVLVQQAYGVKAAMFTHDVLWSFGLIAVVLIYWLIWNVKIK